MKHCPQFLCAHHFRWHVSRFYAIYQAQEAGTLPAKYADVPFSPSILLSKIPTADGALQAALHMLQAGWVGGLTVVLDHPDPARADEPASWLEAVGTLFSFFLEPDTPSVARVLLPQVSRSALQSSGSSAWQLLALAVSPQATRGDQLPGFVFYDDLAAVPPTAWLGFEQVVTLQSTCAGLQGKLG